MAAKRPPATTPEARENQLIDLALDQIEGQLRSGDASSQVLTHYAKLASSRERLEQERMRMEISLLGVKKDAIEAADRIEALYEKAIRHLTRYAGEDVPPELEGGENGEYS